MHDYLHFSLLYLSLLKYPGYSPAITFHPWSHAWPSRRFPIKLRGCKKVTAAKVSRNTRKPKSGPLKKTQALKKRPVALAKIVPGEFQGCARRGAHKTIAPFPATVRLFYAALGLRAASRCSRQVRRRRKREKKAGQMVYNGVTCAAALLQPGGCSHQPEPWSDGRESARPDLAVRCGCTPL